MSNKFFSILLILLLSKNPVNAVLIDRADSQVEFFNILVQTLKKDIQSSILVESSEYAVANIETLKFDRAQLVLDTLVRHCDFSPDEKELFVKLRPKLFFELVQYIGRYEEKFGVAVNDEETLIFLQELIKSSFQHYKATGDFAVEGLKPQSAYRCMSVLLKIYHNRISGLGETKVSIASVDELKSFLEKQAFVYGYYDFIFEEDGILISNIESISNSTLGVSPDPAYLRILVIAILEGWAARPSDPSFTKLVDVFLGNLAKDELVAITLGANSTLSFQQLQTYISALEILVPLSDKKAIQHFEEIHSLFLEFDNSLTKESLERLIRYLKIN